MRVLFLSQYYPPEPVPFQADLVRVLRDHGHEVVVLTSYPCYPHGKIYEGFRQHLIHTETPEPGLKIVRIPQIPDHSKSALRRIAYYTSFMLNSMILGHFSTGRFDIVLVYEAAVVTGLSGWVLARTHRTPVVFYTVDLWPESVISTGMLRNNIALRLVSWLSAFIYRRADKCIGITKGYTRRFVEMGVRREKTDLVYFWAPKLGRVEVHNSGDKPLLPPTNQFRVVYTGNMGPAQDIDSVLDAAKLLLQNGTPAEIVLIGAGLEFPRISERVKNENLKNVRLAGSMPFHLMPALYALGDALLVHLKPDELTKVSIPSKTQSYMQAGKPVLMAVAGEAADFVKEHGFGITAEPSSPVSIANSIKQLSQTPPDILADMGRKGRVAYEHTCSSTVMGAKLVRILKDACRESSCTDQP